MKWIKKGIFELASYLNFLELMKKKFLHESIVNTNLKEKTFLGSSNLLLGV
jgi:hypothetical protein